MSELFDRHRARLTKAEDEKVWGRVREGAARRKRWSVTGWPAAVAATGAALALTVVVVNRDGGPEETLQAFRSGEAPAEMPAVDDAKERSAERAAEEADRGGVHPGATGAGDPAPRRGESSTPKDETTESAEAKTARTEPLTARRNLGDVAGGLGGHAPGRRTTEEAKASEKAEVAIRQRADDEARVRAGARVDLERLRARVQSEPPPSPASPAPPPAREHSWGNVRESYGGEKDGSYGPLAETLRPRPTGPIATGGTHPANGDQIDAMFFRHYGVNPFIETARDALATFAVDVDNASYALVRGYLNRGVMPPPEAVRVEELVNAFDHGYTPPRGDDVADLDPALTHEGTFAIHLDAAPSPLHERTVLLRVGLKGREVAAYERKPLNLTFVVDVSGSMRREGRLELLKRSLIDLLYALDARDEVAIVTYSNTANVVSPPTSLRNRWALEQQIQNLVPQGGTNAEAGLRLAYTLAERAYDPEEENRVVLCSDGVANVGETGPEAILEEIKRSAGRGIYMTAVGVGMGNYNDVLLERIANDGDGSYYYVDTPAEAQRVLVHGMIGTMQTIARDAKIQVELDPDVVASHRLLGYENRDVADADFRNDAVDAGEVGAGHDVTALLELRLAPDAPRRGTLAVVRIRFEDPDTGVVTEDYDTIRLRDVGRAFERMPASFRLDAAVAGFAEILRGSYWARDDTIGDVVEIARGVAAETRGRADVAELLSLMSIADRLSAADPVDWRTREREWLGEQD